MNQSRSKDYIIIIGCGRLGSSIANSMSDIGTNVLVIDNNKDAFRKLLPSFGGLTLSGDAADLDILHEAQIEKATIVLAVTNNDNTNIMVAQIAKALFNIQRVIARLYDPERECIYREFGINTICPSVLSAKEITKLLGNIHEEELQ